MTGLHTPACWQHICTLKLHAFRCGAGAEFEAFRGHHTLISIQAYADRSCCIAVLQQSARQLMPELVRDNRRTSRENVSRLQLLASQPQSCCASACRLYNQPGRAAACPAVTGAAAALAWLTAHRAVAVALWPAPPCTAGSSGAAVEIPLPAQLTTPMLPACRWV